MPYRFVPPVAPLVPPTVRQNHPGHALFRHYRPWDAGLNVFLLKDGTVTTVEPGDPELIDTTFHGGHIHTVEDEIAALLVSAGYVVQLVTVEAPAPGVPSGDYTSPPDDTVYPPGVPSGDYVSPAPSPTPAETPNAPSNPDGFPSGDYTSPPSDTVYPPGHPSGDYTSPPVVVGGLQDVYSDTYSDTYGEGTAAPASNGTYVNDYEAAY